MKSRTAALSIPYKSGMGVIYSDAKNTFVSNDGTPLQFQGTINGTPIFIDVVVKQMLNVPLSKDAKLSPVFHGILNIFSKDRTIAGSPEFKRLSLLQMASKYRILELGKNLSMFTASKQAADDQHPGGAIEFSEGLDDVTLTESKRKALKAALLDIEMDLLTMCADPSDPDYLYLDSEGRYASASADEELPLKDPSIAARIKAAALSKDCDSVIDVTDNSPVSTEEDPNSNGDLDTQLLLMTGD